MSSFWSSFEVLFVNCKVEMKLRWKEHFAQYVLGAATDNTNENPDNIILSSNKQNCMFLLWLYQGITIKSYQNILQMAWKISVFKWI